MNEFFTNDAYVYRVTSIVYRIDGTNTTSDTSSVPVFAGSLWDWRGRPSEESEDLSMTFDVHRGRECVIAGRYSSRSRIPAFLC